MNINKRNTVDLRIYNKFGLEGLQYYKKFTQNLKNAYRMYTINHSDDYESPQVWFKTIRKKENKIDRYIKDTMGDEALRQYQALQDRTKYNYYVYIMRREKIGILTRNLTPNEWMNKKEEADRDFYQIAKILNLPVYKVRNYYASGMRKIKKILIDNPKYREWREFLE